MKVAVILHNKIHQLFESYDMPNWPPDAEGNPIVMIDVTGMDVYENDDYNSETGEITPPSLEIAKVRKLASIVSSRNTSIDLPGAEYNSLHFWCDKGSKSDIQFAIMAYDETTILPSAWKASDGIMPITSREELVGIATAIGVYVESQYQKEFTLSTQVQSATTIEEVKQIVW